MGANEKGTSGKGDRDRVMRGFTGVIIIFFGVVFGGGGAAVFMETGLPMWLDWQQMRHWQPASGHVLSVAGEDNKTTVSYRYRFQGHEYQGQRPYIARFNDNVGDYHRGFQARLNGHVGSGSPITVWVDPLNPAQSVLDRDMRWGLFALMSGFCALFVLIGLALVYAGFRTLVSPSPPRPVTDAELHKVWRELQRGDVSTESFIAFRRRRLHELARESENGPDQKGGASRWQQNKAWQQNRIYSDAGKSALGMWLFALVLNGLSAPALMAMGDELDKGNYAILLVLVFPIAGIWMVVHAARLSLEYLRFGRVELVMDPWPGAVGGQVGATVTIPKWWPKAGQSAPQFSVCLESVFSYMSGSGKNRNRREDVRWFQQGTVTGERAVNGTKLQFYFDVPDHLPASDPHQTGDFYCWRVKISAEMPGVDFDRQFNIPVVRGTAKARFVRNNLSDQFEKVQDQEKGRIKAALDNGQFDTSGLKMAGTVVAEGNRLLIHYPVFRHLGAALFCLVFALGFGFAAWSIVDGFGSATVFGVLALLFAAPFAVVALLSGLLAVYLPFDSCDITVSSAGIDVTYRWMAMPVRHKTVPKQQIDALRVKRSGRSQLGKRTTEYYAVEALSGRNRIALGRNINSESAARGFRDHLAVRLGVASNNGDQQ